MTVANENDFYCVTNVRTIFCDSHIDHNCVLYCTYRTTY